MTAVAGPCFPGRAEAESKRRMYTRAGMKSSRLKNSASSINARRRCVLPRWWKGLSSEFLLERFCGGNEFLWLILLGQQCSLS